jgi:uncharacterized protein
MKTILYSILILLANISFVGAQDITGQWNGLLSLPGGQLRIVFNIEKSNTGFNTTMDSPDQGAKSIPTTSTTYDGNTLKITSSQMRMEYTGALQKSGMIDGTFSQGGQSIPLVLSRTMIEKVMKVRPQEPVKPYAYYTEEVTFKNADVTLSGTLSLPDAQNQHPVVILISGSGPQNRDEEIMGHKPFLVLADYLTKNGIGVLRYDDRGTGASTGDFKSATTKDFASDVEAAISFLQTRKEINKKEIGLIGHSEGGVIAPMVASENKSVNFIVLMAGTGIPGGELLLLQKELLEKTAGEDTETINKGVKINKGAFEIVSTTAADKLEAALENYYTDIASSSPEIIPESMTKDTYVKMASKQLSSPWMQFFISYNPAIALQKVNCPVLAINGDKDLQVPSKVNLDAIKSSLNKSGNQNVTIKEIPGLNHLFQECKSGLPDEYAKIEQTISPVALKEISDWILIQIRN